MNKEEGLGTVHLGEVTKDLSQPPREDALSVAPVPGEANYLGGERGCKGLLQEEAELDWMPLEERTARMATTATLFE